MTANKVFHYEVHGERRGYDYSVFCSACANDAIDFAQEWLIEAWDAIDVDEERTVKIITKPEPASVCYGSCELAKRLRREATDE